MRITRKQINEIVRRAINEWRWEDDPSYSKKSQFWIDNKEGSTALVKDYVRWVREEGHITPSASSVVDAYVAEKGLGPEEQNALYKEFFGDDYR